MTNEEIKDTANKFLKVGYENGFIQCLLLINKNGYEYVSKNYKDLTEKTFNELEKKSNKYE